MTLLASNLKIKQRYSEYNLSDEKYVYPCFDCDAFCVVWSGKQFNAPSFIDEQISKMYRRYIICMIDHRWESALFWFLSDMLNPEKLFHWWATSYDSHKVGTEKATVSTHLSYQPTDTSRFCIFSGYSPNAATLVLSATKACEWNKKKQQMRSRQLRLVMFSYDIDVSLIIAFIESLTFTTCFDFPFIEADTIGGCLWALIWHKSFSY